MLAIIRLAINFLKSSTHVVQTGMAELSGFYLSPKCHRQCGAHVSQTTEEAQHPDRMKRGIPP